MFKPVTANKQYKLATRMAEKTIPSFDLSGSASRVADRWHSWKRAFEYYAQGKNITDPGRKTAQLLHMAGMALQDIFEDLPAPEPENEDDTEYDVCIRKLDTYFHAEDNVPYERHVFRQMAPTEGERADQFLSRLRKQARHCNFGDSLNDNLRDQLIEKLRDMELKKNLLQTNNITLAAAMDRTRAWEAAHVQVREMTEDSGATGGPTVANAVSGVKGNCFRCGKHGHYAKSRDCPARGKKCAKCKMVGHFAVCCKSNKKPADKKKGKSGKEANSVVGEEEGVSNVDYAFSVSDSKEHEVIVSSVIEPAMEVYVNGIALTALIDSGSVCNLMGEEDLQRLRSQGLKVSLGKCDRNLFAYGGAQLDVVGQFQASLSVASGNVTATFVVVKKGRCLIGSQSATQLGILHIGLSPRPTTVSSTYNVIQVDELKSQYPDVFQGIGKLKDYQLKLHVDPQIEPVAQKVRRIPFSLREKVKVKVNELIDQDIVERVQGPTTWVSPIVVAPKPSGDIRLCVDMRQANTAIKRERLPIPTIDEVLEELNGSAVFSKLDLKWGFHQIELDESSRDITTFITPDGLFRYKRLSFGINSAPEKYQHIIGQILADINGVVNIADDLVVHGKDEVHHDAMLHQVLQRLQEKGLTLNEQKCSFKMKRVEFMGMLLSQHGIGPTEERVKAVTQARRPSSPSEVRSFLGMVGFSSRFIPDFATKADPLRKLTRDGEVFEWGKEQERSFVQLKRDLADSSILAYFDKDAQTRVVADASPVGLGAVLVQEKNGQSRAVAYASRSLSPVERRYSQTEKEALALVWACERFHLYLYGLEEFDLVTDHEALKCIFSRRSTPSLRVERWVLRLQSYNYKVCYVKSRENIADALSRLTKIPAASEYKADDEYVRQVVLQAVPNALRIQEIERASERDEELRLVIESVRHGRWERIPKEYLPVRNELTTIGYVLMRGSRIVIPKELRSRVVDLAHEGHQGIVKTKERLRSKVWWPGIDREAEQKCKQCYGCQMTTKNIPPPPVKPTPMPDKPWQELALDLLGPLPKGESLLVLVDYFSRWYEVDVIISTTSTVITKCLDGHFSRHGIPRGLKTDNGSNLVSDELDSYLLEMGIEHRHTTPLWPRANGEVERQNRSLLKAMRAYQAEGKDWRKELNKFLLAYRSTSHSTTGASPAEMLFNRKLTTKLPDYSDEVEECRPSYQGVRDRDAERKQKCKDYVDSRFQAVDRDIKEGDQVFLEKRKENKLSPSFDKQPYTVVNRYGDQLTIMSPQGVQYKRNMKHVKRFLQPGEDNDAGKNTQLERVVEPDSVESDLASCLPESETTAGPEAASTPSRGHSAEILRRSDRIRSRPKALSDYELG